MTEFQSLEEKIKKQQEKLDKNSPEYVIGNHLLSIASDNPSAAAILNDDIDKDGMKLIDIAKELKKYSDKNHGKASCFCIPPEKAEEIFRDFYKYPEKAKKAENEIDLANFL